MNSVLEAPDLSFGVRPKKQTEPDDYAPTSGRRDYQPLKIYILIRDSVDVGHAVNCAAHASLQLYLEHWDDPLVEDWVKNSFRKVSCKVTDAQFDEAKQHGRFVMVTESKLPEPEVALAFLPRREWEPFFKTLKLYA